MKSFDALEVNDSRAGPIDLELFLYTEVLKLKSLHFGYWTNGQAPTLQNLPAAQAEYTRTMIEMIPGGVETVLDVGCGAGDNARALAADGYKVTAISPDAQHGKFVEGTPGITFIRTGIEDFQTEQTFDLILMSECQNYFDREVALEKCALLTSQGGYLLISGIFRRENTVELEEIYVGTEYVAGAKEAGFDLLQHIDITAETAPTTDLFNQLYTGHVLPAVDLLSHYFNGLPLVKRLLFKVLVGSQKRKLSEMREFFESRTDAEYFLKFSSYDRFLLQRRRLQP